MLIKYQGHRFVFLEVGKFRVSFVGSIGSVYPALPPEIPVPMCAHTTVFSVCSPMNSLCLRGER